MTVTALVAGMLVDLLVIFGFAAAVYVWAVALGGM